MITDEYIINELIKIVKKYDKTVNNGKWVTINGKHIYIEDGETLAQAFKRVTGKSLIFRKQIKKNNNKTKKQTKENNFKELSEKSLNESRKQVENLSELEIYSIKKYTNRDICKQINGVLRGDLKTVSKSIKEHIKNIENALKKASLPQDTILYRGVDNNFIESEFGKEIAKITKSELNEENLLKLKHFLKGQDWTEKGFMSTSYKKENAYDKSILLKINAPKGINALVIDEISDFEQSESLIIKGYKWRIEKIEIEKKDKKNKWEFTIKLV